MSVRIKQKKEEQEEQRRVPVNFFVPLTDCVEAVQICLNSLIYALMVLMGIFSGFRNAGVHTHIWIIVIYSG